MSAYTQQLYDDDGNVVYPVSQAKSTYMQGGVVTVQTVLDDMKEAGQKTEFLEDGTIKKTLASGNVVTTKFMQNGSIQETTTDPDGNEICIKITTFGSDGSITTNVTYNGEEKEEGNV